MKTLSKISLALIAFLLLDYSVLAEDNADLIPEETAENSSVANDDQTEAEEVTEEEESAPKKFAMPSMKDIGMELKEKQGGLNGKYYLSCLKLLKLDNPNSIKDFYGRFREIDKSVNTAGKSTYSSRFAKESKTSAFKKKHGKIKIEKGEHFVIIYPEFISVGKKKSSSKKLTAETIGIDNILSKADESFGEAAKLVLIDKFINWAGKVKAKIFIVTDENLWRMIRTGTAKARPDQMVITKDKNREFFVYINPDTFDSAPEALAYAVTQLVLKEYSRAVSRKSDSKLPLFYLTGAAFDISGLDSVILETGPKQLKKWNGKEITSKSIRELRKRSGELKQLPLSKNDLIKLSRIVMATECPKHGEDVYYYASQSSALIKYLRENGQLPFLVMSKMLAKGESFNKAFDKGYVSFRDRLLGKDKKSKNKKNKKDKKSRKDRKKEAEKNKDAKDTLSGYKELNSQAEEVIFFPLTKEYLKGEMMDKKKESKSSRRRK